MKTVHVHYIQKTQANRGALLRAIRWQVMCLLNLHTHNHTFVVQYVQYVQFCSMCGSIQKQKPCPTQYRHRVKAYTV